MTYRRRKQSKRPIKFSDFTPPHFYELASEFVKDEKGHYWLDGGRGSIKTSMGTALIIVGLLNDPQSHAVFARLYKVDLHNSVFAQVKKTISILKLEHLFKISTTDAGAPPITVIATGQKIMFVGLDDPDSIRGATPPFGYLKYSLLDEIQQFDGMPKIRAALQSIRRGADINFVTFYCYNPPRSKNNWTFEAREAMRLNPKAYVHSSNWEMLPPELATKWLGQSFIDDALHMKNVEIDQYNHEYMGIPVGYGTDVFKNLNIRKITNDEIANFENIQGGLDWGFAEDPTAYSRSHYDKANKVLYIFDEIYEKGLHIPELASILGSKLKDVPWELITSDNTPRELSEIRRLRFNVIGAKKARGSVESGTRFLQSLNEIVIDGERCPNAAMEFTTAEFEISKQGEVLPRVRDKNNHIIDGVRYRMESESRAVWGKGTRA